MRWLDLYYDGTNYILESKDKDGNNKIYLRGKFFTTIFDRFITKKENATFIDIRKQGYYEIPINEMLYGLFKNVINRKRVQTY